MASQHSLARWLGVVVTAAALAVGCSNSTEPGVPGTGSPHQDSGSPKDSGSPTISANAAKQLCDMIRPEVEKWRAEDPIEARLKFNVTVQDWALRNNGVNIAVMRNRSVIDQTTTAACPDVRDAAVQAIRMPDLASGLAGF
ncbi:hypothetical protein ABZ412_08000 [Nocardia sp. NPDC005746]|uniref:hypothetical protein n=1 Tax=unclassified Nocardia TaxID=2637762 RepID=UPI0033C3F9E8